MSKKTIAIIEAAGNIGSAIAKRLAKGNYRLLLFAHETKKLNSLAEEIRSQTPTADIDCMGCAAEASWEADIIISAVRLSEQEEIVKKIEPFANRKILISISCNEKNYRLITSRAIRETKGLQKLLPGTKVVKLFNISFDTNGIHSLPFITGNDDEALQTVKEILEAADFDRVQLINQKTKEHEKVI
jgi:8-hydroxy-5-deazaflavin:NADPH oxidoreductase